MRAVIQAVSSASVRVNGGEPRPIGPGLVILLPKQLHIVRSHNDK